MRERRPALLGEHVRLAFGVWTAVCLGWLAVTWIWSAIHLTMAVDDTFYYFKTALNVSRGLGSSFDGINPTNGYHPLWLGLLALLFSPFTQHDMVFLSRVVFTVQVLLVWLAGIVLSRLRDLGGARVLWPLSLAMINPFAAKILLCGQETALQLLMSSLVLGYWWSLRGSPDGYRPRQWVGLALLCVLATLSRLDTIFFCGIVLAMPLAVPSERERAGGLAARLRITAIGVTVLGLGLAPYLGFNLMKYGHLMPVSGAIKLTLSLDEIAPWWARLAVSIAAAGCMLVLWAGARRTRTPTMAVMVPLVGAALVLVVYNLGVRGEMSPGLVRIWYLEPYLLAAVVIGGVCFASETPGRAVPVLVAALTAVWLVVSAASWQYRVEPRSYSLYSAAERCSRWLEGHAGADAIGASWDAGFSGAFTRRPVMNLDGLISSWEFKQNYLDRGKVDEFVFSRHPVDYVIQYAWPQTLRRIAQRFKNEPLPGVPRLQTTVLGSHDREALSGRWGVDLAAFYVAHVECVMVAVAYNASETIGPVDYFVLSRAPLGNRPTLAEYALANANRDSCEGPSGR